MRIGFMQGRLSKIERNRIQSFPFKNWINEFSSARKHNFKLIEIFYPALLLVLLKLLNF